MPHFNHLLRHHLNRSVMHTAARSPLSRSPLFIFIPYQPPILPENQTPHVSINLVLSSSSSCGYPARAHKLRARQNSTRMQMPLSSIRNKIPRDQTCCPRVRSLILDFLSSLRIRRLQGELHSRLRPLPLRDVQGPQAGQGILCPGL